MSGLDTPGPPAAAPPPPRHRSDPADEQWISAVYIGRRTNFIRAHRQVVTLVVLAGSFATCLAMCAVGGWGTIGNRLGHLAWWFVPVMIASHLTAYAGYLVAHHQVVNRSRSITVGWRRDIQLVVIGFGGWLVGGGFAVDRQALEIEGVSRDNATISTITLGLLELLVLTPATWVCAVILIGHRGIPAVVTWPWVIGVPVGCACTLGAVLIIPRSEALPPTRAAAALTLVATATRATLTLVSRPDRGPLVIAGIAVYWAGDIAALWAALRFLSISLGVAELIVAYATGYILTRRTLPFAGVIVIEVLLAISLWSVGPTLAEAALAVLVYRLSDFALTLGAALLASSAMEHTLLFIAAEAGLHELPARAGTFITAASGPADRRRDDATLESPDGLSRAVTEMAHRRAHGQQGRSGDLDGQPQPIAELGRTRRPRWPHR
jgi:hypothetical protein